MNSIVGGVPFTTSLMKTITSVLSPLCNMEELLAICLTSYYRLYGTVEHMPKKGGRGIGRSKMHLTVPTYVCA